MKTINFQRLIIISLVLLCAHTAQAQVTVGSDLDSPAAALLNIQDQADSNPTQGGVTATGGGVLLPRVVLEEVTSLKPFIATGGTSAEKAAHKGMNVYNIGGNGIDPGQYVWDGGKWLLLLTDVPATPIVASSQRGLTARTTVGSNVDYNSTTSYTQCNDDIVVLPFETITITELGYYAFNVRFFANYKQVAIDALLPLTQGPYVWISLLVNGTIVDSQEYYLPYESPVAMSSHMATMASTLTGYCPVGADVRISLQVRSNANAIIAGSTTRGVMVLWNSDSQYPSPESWAGRSSVVFWKL